VARRLRRRRKQQRRLGSDGRPKMVSDPPLPQVKARSEYWMKPAQGKAVRQFVEAGGAALFLHNTTNVSLADPDFRHVMGGVYTGHPPIRTFKVKVTNSDHPITQGVKDFVVTDEQHYMTYDKDPKFLLLQTVNEDGAHVSELRSHGSRRLGLRLWQGPRLLYVARAYADESVEPGVCQAAAQRCSLAHTAERLKLCPKRPESRRFRLVRW